MGERSQFKHDVASRYTQILYLRNRRFLKAKAFRRRNSLFFKKAEAILRRNANYLKKIRRFCRRLQIGVKKNGRPGTPPPWALQRRRRHHHHHCHRREGNSIHPRSKIGPEAAWCWTTRPRFPTILRSRRRFSGGISYFLRRRRRFRRPFPDF